jgi:tetratricopeptide (TPR) repeat protein
MSRSPDERVKRESGLGICQRQGLKAFITGTIAKFDRNYSLTLEALNGQTGDSLAIVQSEAEGKDQVLKALSRAASELRAKLGESLSSIKKFDAPLEVTTSSLDALKEFALGQDAQTKGQFLKAIEFYRRALEKDPNFALAWLGLAVQYSNTGQPGLAAENATKAYALRDRVSEDERARITYFYYQIVTGELDKAIEVQEAYVRDYPRDAPGPGNLATRYSLIGQTEKAVAADREAMRLNPNSASWSANLAFYLIRLNRYAEAGEVLQRALAQKLDSINIHQQLYNLAFINGDAKGMQEQVAWASGKPDEYRAVGWQMQAASFAGEWRKSHELLRRATELALRASGGENAAGYTADQAVRAAWLGQSTQAVTLAEAALKIERDRPSLTSAALALALTGEATKAQPLIQELEQKYPKDTRVNQLWLPEIKAALALRKGQPQAALDLLEGARRYEPADEFKPQSLRVLAYLKLGKGAEASAEARKILDHRGEGPLSLLWPLAQLALGRAAALPGDTTQARQSYDAFFALWKNADADLPVLIEAKKEYAKLK